MQKKRTLLLLIIALFPIFMYAQSGRISGKVIDAENGNPIAGATIILLGNEQRTILTDVEGGFFLLGEKNKKYSVDVSSIGYNSKQITDIEIADNKVPLLNISLQRKKEELETVVVKASARKEAQASLYNLQKSSSSISDGISAELIRKSPDKNTGDVLKRVSGTSVQDNKFVIIRGLSERYNVSLLNSSVLPSTEADKKAFAFDIIPSAVVDNLVIYKSPTPDLPGDFSGGAVKIITKDYPSRKINELAVSLGYNTLTTGKNFYAGYPKGKYDALGFFDNSRLIPGPYSRNKNGFISNGTAFKKDVTKLFPNTYGFVPAMQSAPSLSASYTSGNTILFNNGSKFGYIYFLGYSNGRNVSQKNRSDYDITRRFLYDYNTVNYDEKNNETALLNLSYSYKKSKISLKNLFNNSFVKTVGIRSGANYENGASSPFYIKSVNSEATQNGLINSVLEGLHHVGKNWTIDWSTSFCYTYKNQPDQRVLAFRSPENEKDNYYLRLSNENSPEIRNAGRVYSFLSENIYGASINASKDFKWLGRTQKLKFGTMNYYRARSVEVMALGYASLSFLGTTIPESKTVSYNNIFSPGNIDSYDLTVANIETNSTDYTGNALLNAGYIMLDNKFSDKIKFTWGARIEKYRQQLKAQGKGIKTYDNTDILPSFLLTYSASTKTNIRFAASQAVNRPEFRELADYSIFDYDNYLVVRGNPNLVRCKNSNADFRYEWFPAAGEIISASIFYKYFDKPIEQTNQGNDVLSYQNADHATAYGAELEIRKKLGFINGKFFDRLTVYANAAYIKGSVQFDGLTTSSPLQGQSPYLINSGLNYVSSDDGFSFNILYNKIGPRLRFRAVGGAGLSIFERPRDVIDLQISKKFLKNNKLEAKITLSDLFAQPFTWYYKYTVNPGNTNYKPLEDKIIYTSKYGTTATLSIRYSFGK